MTRIHSAAGCCAARRRAPQRPPFRAPHHQASIVSLVGGGSWSLRPGEVSLATHGVLFLDELGEFPVAALEALRQPLEEGVIRVSRAGGTVTFPAAFLLVAAMNPCPCGEGVYEGACRCSVVARARYRRRISAPLLDRFDLVVPLSRPDPDELLSVTPGEPSAAVAARVAAAVHARAAAAGSECPLDLAADAEALLAAKLRAGDLSARGLHKVTRVAQTVATSDGDEWCRSRTSPRPSRSAWPGGRRDMTSPVCPNPVRTRIRIPEEAYAVALASTPVSRAGDPARLPRVGAAIGRMGEEPEATGIAAGDGTSSARSQELWQRTSATWDHGAPGGQPDVPEPTG